MNFFLDEDDRPRMWRVLAALVIGCAVLIFVLDFFIGMERDQDCANLCLVMEGQMRARTEYGCVCWINGEPYVFDGRTRVVQP